MNIAKRSVTPDLGSTYAAMSSAILDRIGLPVSSYPDAAAVEARFPYLRADLADLDVTGGLVDLPAVTAALTATLAEAKAGVHEQVTTTGIEPQPDGTIRITTDLGVFLTRTLVITAGHGTNDVLRLLPGSSLQIPITKDRPSEARYFTPPAQTRHQFTSDVMPVIAYLDTGVYLHPIVEGLIDKVKIGYYNPPDVARDTTGVDSIAAFVEQCMPGIAGSAITDVEDVDRCDYDLVADDDFVLGPVPGADGVYVGVGWRGTGYKFAPWIGRTLFELACREGTVYDIARFRPSRFRAEKE
jgi:glycine/D-amino acid oxidase-like deaminating enzyme